MILYPPAKINLGLNILRKREDAYHDIDTCMVEIPFTDILEVTKVESFEFLQTGIIISGAGGPNFCEKAYDLLKNEFNIGPVRIHLRKQIPVGAGLGGGHSRGAGLQRFGARQQVHHHPHEPFCPRFARAADHRLACESQGVSHGFWHPRRQR